MKDNEISAAKKFSIIRETMLQEDNTLSVSRMCEIAGVSRSGYYNWVASAGFRDFQEERDRAAFQLILNAFNYRGYKKGARSIYMRLLHQDPPVVMNIKKIRRLMKKYGLQCPIRKVNPHRQKLKLAEENYVAPNLVQREFKIHGPRSVLLTDITYLFYDSHRQRCYLSTILDAYTMQILAWVTSESMEVDFVLQTVENLIRDHGVSLSAETLIHSDQGVHYRSIKFSQLVKDSALRQSMSRKANCWDNAPQESFFGHMKDEIDISGCKTFSEVTAVINDYMDYYNKERHQWSLSKLSPDEFYEYTMTGIYPIVVPKSKGDY